MQQKFTLKSKVKAKCPFQCFILLYWQAGLLLLFNTDCWGGAFCHHFISWSYVLFVENIKVETRAVIYILGSKILCVYSVKQKLGYSSILGIPQICNCMCKLHHSTHRLFCGIEEVKYSRVTMKSLLLTILEPATVKTYVSETHHDNFKIHKSPRFNNNSIVAGFLFCRKSN